MDGFLDTTDEGVTELRVHGVSGTPPEDMLNFPHPRLVAGDGTTGFYRRWWPGGQPAGEQIDVPGVRHREAYAWGGLTSGGRTIALWLLLLPFSLTNLAYFMLPRPEGTERLRHWIEGALRVFALLLTGTLVGAVTRSSVDLIGWQCTAAGRACTYNTAPAWVHWMGELWGADPSRRLAVTALVPFAVVALLWWIARHTWARDERTVMPANGSEHDRLLLAQPRLWHGGEPVWRLRAVHVSFAIGSIGLAVSAPFTGAPAGLALTVANAAVQVAAVVLVSLPAIARRTDPGASAAPALSRACLVLRHLSLLIFASTLLAAAIGLPLRGSAPYQLPTAGAGVAQFALLIGLVLFLLVATWRLARRSPKPADPIERRALGGMASWFVLMVASSSVNALALGLSFWTAAFFGVPDSPLSLARREAVDRKLYLDDPVWWTAALLPVLVAGLAIVAGVLLRIRRRTAAEMAPELAKTYQADGAQVARNWALASLTDKSGLALGLMTGIGLAGFAVVTIINLFHLLPPVGGIAGLLATIGSWALATLLVGLVLLGRRTYNDSRLRRMIGILWDIATFWPRAIHPLAPPCYTERVIPELVTRVKTLTKGEQDQVILSGHSQGSVIAAALVLQLKPEVTPKIRLLTHGSPLRRLYATYFPAYFGTDALATVRGTVCWKNLYRLGDPIGGPVFLRNDPVNNPLFTDGDDDTVDRFCWDPPLPVEDEPLQRASWHSDYFLDPLYDRALTRLTATVPSPRSPC